jgi:hypothetical protein
VAGPDRQLSGLDPDEHLVASAAASFRGATAASAQSMFALGSTKARMRFYDAWREHAEGAGFPTAGPEMVVGLTERRLVVCRATFWMSRPAVVEDGVRLRVLAGVATARHGLVTGFAFVFANGTVVEVEAILGRRLRRFAGAVQEALTQHSQ